MRFFATVQLGGKPVPDFGLNPSHSVRVELYPLGELPGLFQTRDVLRRMQDHPNGGSVVSVVDARPAFVAGP